MRITNIDMCHKGLMDIAENQGYLTFDDILKFSDTFNLSVSDVDALSEAIQLRGIIIYEDKPDNYFIDELDDYSRIDYESLYKEIIELDDSLNELINDIRACPPPQYGEVAALVRQSISGNQFARERLIMMYLRSALKVALSLTKKYDLDITDAVSTAFTGLIHAIDRYNPDGFSAFHSYACIWIQQNIQRFCNPKWVEFYFPSHYKEKMYQVYQKYVQLDGDIDDIYDGDKLLINNVANVLQLSEDDVKKYLRRALTQINGKKSLEEIIENSDYEELDMYFFDRDESPYQIVEKKELCDALKNVMETLSEREALVIKMRYGIGYSNCMTLEEIGKSMNVTRERIRQIEGRALKKLRHPTRLKKLKDFLDI